MVEAWYTARSVLRASFCLFLIGCSQQMSPCDGGCAADPIAQGATYRDLDPSQGSTKGALHIQRAADESGLDAYLVYWADKTGKKLSVLQKVAKTGADIDVMIASPVPAVATSFVIIATSNGRESARSLSIGPVDNYPRRTELGMDSAQSPCVAVDPDMKRPIVATSAAAAMEVPLVYLCDSAAASCNASTLAAPPQSGKSPSAVFDSGRLLLVTTHGGNGNRANLLSCNPDGTDCALADLSAGLGIDSGLFPSAASDGAGKLLACTRNQTTPWLSRCSVAGTGCSGRDVSGGGPGFDAADTRSGPILSIGAGNLFVTWQTATAVQASHCAIDGTGCAFADIGMKSGVPAARDPRAVFDPMAQKLLAVVRNPADSDKPYVIRCSQDLASCTSSDISAGQGAGKLPAIALDSTNQKIHVVTSNNGVALLISCAADATACSALPMNPSAHDVAAASLAIDEGSQRLIAAWNEDGGAKTVLFQIGLW
jgi:hypothetical protein